MLPQKKTCFLKLYKARWALYCSEEFSELALLFLCAQIAATSLILFCPSVPGYLLNLNVDLRTVPAGTSTAVQLCTRPYGKVIKYAWIQILQPLRTSFWAMWLVTGWLIPNWLVDYWSGHISGQESSIRCATGWSLVGQLRIWPGQFTPTSCWLVSNQFLGKPRN